MNNYTLESRPLRCILLTMFTFFLFSNLSFSQTAIKEKSKLDKPVEDREKPQARKDISPFSESSIEDISKRTQFSKVFKNTDGSNTAQIGGEYHYRAENGLWEDIDLSIETKLDGSFQMNKASVKVQFPKLSSVGLVRMKVEDGNEFNWWTGKKIDIKNNGNTLVTWQPSTVEGTANDNVLTYSQIYPSISEQFVTMSHGIENNLILHTLTNQIANLPVTSTLNTSHFIPLQNGWIVRDDSGTIQTSDFESKTFSIQIGGVDNQLYFGQTVLFDASTTKEEAMLIHMPFDKLTETQRNVIENHVLAINHNIRFVNGGIEVTAIIAVSWLQNTARQYPVTIDPTVTITPPSSVSNFYGPLTRWFGYQRHASLYLQSEINAYGHILSLEYNSTSAGTAANTPTEIYLKNFTGNTLSTGNWNSNTYTNGAHLGLNASTNQGNTPGWKLLNLSSTFIYDSGNLLIMLSDKYGGAGNVKNYNQSGVIAGRQVYNRTDSNDPGNGAFLSTDINRLTEIRINYLPLVSCTGLPSSISITNSITEVCPSRSFTLNTDIEQLLGYSLQWQKSTDGQNWSDIGQPIAIDGNFNVTNGIVEPTSFRAIARCAGYSGEIVSNVIHLDITDYETCYCIPSIPYNCNEGDLMTNVTFQEINNSTGCGINGYTDYTTTQPVAQVSLGQTYPFSATVGDGWDYESVAVWIDFNHNGVLDSLEGEYFPIGRGRNTVVSNTITIPSTAMTGATRMRVSVTASFMPSNSYVCGATNANNIYGEIEDYLIFINPALDSIVVETVGNIPATINTYQGELNLQAKIYPLSANQAVTWSLIPVTGAATISNNGIVTASSNGTVWAKAISVVNSLYKDSILVTISNQHPPIDSLVVATIGNVPAEINTYLGTLDLEAIIYPSTTNQDVTWSLIPVTGNATISSTGVVSALMNGTVWAKAISDFDHTKMDSILITVTNQYPPIDSLVITTIGNVPAVISTILGTLDLQATVYPLNSNQDVTWSIVQETGTATITSTGVVSALMDGIVWAKAISVYDNSKVDSIQINITNQQLAISDLSNTSAISIYPNPTADLVYLQSTENFSDVVIIISDLNGKIILTANVEGGALINGHPINLSQFTTGNYILQVKGTGINYLQRITRN